MNLVELRKNDHLSASAVNEYLSCSLAFKFGRIDRILPEFTADALEFGKAIHRALEDFHTEKMRGTYLSVKQLQECFENHWRRIIAARDDIKYAEGNDADILLLQGKELLTAYVNKAPIHDYECIAVEEAFSFNIEGCPLPIIGAIDLVEIDSSGTIIITDFKTSARAYSFDEVERNFQLTLYQMAMKANGHDGADILLRFDCLLKKKSPSFESYYTTRSVTDEIRAKKKIVTVAKGIAKGIFIPNDDFMNWRCKGCIFKKRCDSWYLGEEVAA